nr:zinc finger, CCHC-type [Tanacetum cinerariifolium]
MHFLLSIMSVVYVLTTSIHKDGGDDATMEQIRKSAKWDNDDYVCRGLILNDFKHTLKHLEEELTLVELSSHLRIEESLRVQDSDKPKGNNVAGPSVVNMVEHNNSSRCSWCGGPFNDENCRHCTNLEHAANLSIYTTEPSRRFNSFCYDDDDYGESTIPLKEIVSQIPPSIAITPVLPTMEPEDSLIIGDEDLNTIPEKESDELIKSSVEDLNLIISESEDTSGSDSECDLPLCDDFYPINALEGKSVIFSNPLFNLNDDFTTSDDESLSDEDIPKDKVKIYSNPLFEFDDEYISSDVNPLFDEVLEDIESKDKCFDLRDDVDEIELLLHQDPFTPKMSVASILEGFTNEPPLKENDDLFDLESTENE